MSDTEVKELTEMIDECSIESENKTDVDEVFKISYDEGYKKDYEEAFKIPINFYNELMYWSNDEKRNIEKEKNLNRNLCFAFNGLGDKGEEFALYMYPNSIGGSSKGGMAFDNIELDENMEIKFAREIKFVCREGTKECKKCKKKCPRFQNECIFCNGNEFKLISDSRASLSSTAHLKYKELQEYIIFVMDFNEKKFIINLKSFKFLSTNKYFDAYIKNQHDNSKSKTCNFIPYSYDWHLSGPIKIMNVDIDISGDETKITTEFYDTTSMVYEDVPKTIFSNEEIQKYNITNEYTEYNEIKEKNIPLRKKNLNKSRGTVTRK